MPEVKKEIDLTKLLSIPEYAKLRGVVKTTMYRAVELGELTLVRIGPKGDNIFINPAENEHVRFGRWKGHVYKHDARRNKKRHI